MNKLEKKENLTLDSKEVAQMVEKNHAHLLRDIETYISYISENPKLDSQSFFMESEYKVDGNNKTYKCYQITKKGCEFIAHKLTGQKGALFTATYINKFHEMESAIKQQQTKIASLTKQQEIEARLKNAKVREANIYLKIADKVEIPEYKQIMYSKATEVLSGEQLLPLPVVEKVTYSATEIGDKLGISANKVGRLAKEHNLKTEQYGKWFYDKSRYSNKQVQSFRYYEDIIPVIKTIGELGNA